MLIQLNQKQIKLQNELQEYFENLITPALKSELNQPEYFEGGGPEFKKAMRTMGSDGWIGLSWKKEFGGKELSSIEQYIFVETVMRTGFPFPFLTTESVGPMIAEHGSEWAKEEIDKNVNVSKIGIHECAIICWVTIFYRNHDFYVTASNFMNWCLRLCSEATEPHGPYIRW